MRASFCVYQVGEGLDVGPLDVKCSSWTSEEPEVVPSTSQEAGRNVATSNAPETSTGAVVHEKVSSQDDEATREGKEEDSRTGRSQDDAKDPDENETAIGEGKDENEAEVSMETSVTAQEDRGSIRTPRETQKPADGVGTLTEGDDTHVTDAGVTTPANVALAAADSGDDNISTNTSEGSSSGESVAMETGDRDMAVAAANKNWDLTGAPTPFLLQSLFSEENSDDASL